ncbi:MAG: hypothetical protein ACJ75H_06415 [Thermoanaerobaculia bacterium]
MPETRRASSASRISTSQRRREAARPRPPHPAPESKAPLRVLDETLDLGPVMPKVVAKAPERPPAREPRPARNAPQPLPRRVEPTVLSLLLVGMVLNVLVLLRTPALTRADMLLGGTVLGVGFALLLLIEASRRNGFRRRG